MIENQQIAQEEVSLPEPNNSDNRLTKEEINQKINHFWLEIDKTTDFQSYKEAFDNLNYYRDLKQSLYK